MSVSAGRPPPVATGAPILGRGDSHWPVLSSKCAMVSSSGALGIVSIDTRATLGPDMSIPALVQQHLQRHRVVDAIRLALCYNSRPTVVQACTLLATYLLGRTSGAHLHASAATVAAADDAVVGGQAPKPRGSSPPWCTALAAVVAARGEWCHVEDPSVHAGSGACVAGPWALVVLKAVLDDAACLVSEDSPCVSALQLLYRRLANALVLKRMFKGALAIAVDLKSSGLARDVAAWSSATAPELSVIAMHHSRMLALGSTNGGARTSAGTVALDHAASRSAPFALTKAAFSAWDAGSEEATAGASFEFDVVSEGMTAAVAAMHPLESGHAHDGAGVDVPAEVQGLAVAVKRAAVAECEGKWPAAISILERALGGSAPSTSGLEQLWRQQIAAHIQRLQSLLAAAESVRLPSERVVMTS